MPSGRGSRAHLEGSAKGPGPSGSETEGQDASKLAPKIEFLGGKKRSENVSIIGSLLGSKFSMMLGRFWEAQWHQVGIKMEFNIDRTSKSDFMNKYFLLNKQ